GPAGHSRTGDGPHPGSGVARGAGTEDEGSDEGDDGRDDAGPDPRPAHLSFHRGRSRPDSPSAARTGPTRSARNSTAAVVIPAADSVRSGLRLPCWPWRRPSATKEPWNGPWPRPRPP